MVVLGISCVLWCIWEGVFGPSYPNLVAHVWLDILRRFRFNQGDRGIGVGHLVDADGFRPNVGIVLSNKLGQVLWARRVGGQDAWQFPQGGIDDGESAEDALYRELSEEVGLMEKDVSILGKTNGWLRYRLPKHMRRNNSHTGFQGQKQKWFLLKLLSADQSVDVQSHDKPEFDGWRWVSYWYPINQVVDFKQDVYRKALKELVPFLDIKNGFRH